MDNNTVEYNRKSEEDKKRQVLSIEDQHNENTSTIQRNSLSLVADPFNEEKSAKAAGKRIEFYKMVDLLKTGKAKNIVVWQANRLARNLLDGSVILDLIQNHGVKIYTPYTVYDSTNWFMLLIEFGMATDYSLKLSKDVKRGLKSKVEKGIKPGIAPLGYKNIGEIKGFKDIDPDAERFDLCAKWWEMILSGQYNVLESLEKITEMGLRDRRGDKIPKTTAFRFFHNIFYAGYFDYSGARHKGTHRPMITLEQFNKAQKIISGELGGIYEVPIEKTPLPLTGFIKCGECGATIIADRKIKCYKNGKLQEFTWYRCKKNKGQCAQKAYLQADGLDDQAIDYINDLELKPDFISWVKDVVKRRNKDEFNFDIKQRELGAKRLELVRKRKFELNEMKIDGLFTQEQYKGEVAKIVKEENDIEELLSSNRSDYWSKVINETLDFAQMMYELFKSKDPQLKRFVVQILGSDLTLEDRILNLKPKTAFMFLKSKQVEFFAQNVRSDSINEAKTGKILPKLPLGADNGNRTHDLILTKNVLYH